MNTPNSPLPSAAGDPSSPSREDGFARVLKHAAQPSGLAAGFAARVAAEARRRAARRRRENLLLGLGLLGTAVGLALCGLLGWTVAPPTALMRLPDGPYPLVLTALACLSVMGFLAPARPRSAGRMP